MWHIEILGIDFLIFSFAPERSLVKINTKRKDQFWSVLVLFFFYGFKFSSFFSYVVCLYFKKYIIILMTYFPTFDWLCSFIVNEISTFSHSLIIFI